MDNDGDLDVGITHMYAPFAIYRNTLYEAQEFTSPAVKKHWIGFTLKGNGVTCNRDAAGSRLKIFYEEHGQAVQQMREIQIVNAFAAQGDRRAQFGLGDYAETVDIEVSWCGGQPQYYTKFQIDRYHTIEQPLLEVDRVSQ